MSGGWINFALFLVVQFLIFVAFAFYEKKLSNVEWLLVKGFLIGIPLGLGFDLILGKSLGLSSYTLGFGAPFLLLNAAFSYGIFAATILLLHQQRPLYFYISILFITALYEITNLFLHIWKWQFPVPIFLFPIVLSIGYIAGAILVLKINRLFR